MQKVALPKVSEKSLELYLSELRRFPLLTKAEEQRLARAYRHDGDSRSAHRLVTANLRFVVKIARQYRSHGVSMVDLIQEGNIGLLRAVQKFDPDQDIRLITYAVWWIRSCIQGHVLRSWSLVRLGTTQAQRKIFFSLSRARREIEQLSAQHGFDPDAAESFVKIAGRLGVKESELEEMALRMGGHDLSLDAPLGDDEDSSHGDFVASEGPAQDHLLSCHQERSIAQRSVADALACLNPRERYIIEQRAMRDEPMTLKEVGAHFGFSRARAQQLEMRAKGKLKTTLRSLATQMDWPVRSSGGPLARPPRGEHARSYTGEPSLRLIAAPDRPRATGT